MKTIEPSGVGKERCILHSVVRCSACVTFVVPPQVELPYCLIFHRPWDCLVQIVIICMHFDQWQIQPTPFPLLGKAVLNCGGAPLEYNLAGFMEGNRIKPIALRRTSPKALLLRVWVANCGIRSCWGGGQLLKSIVSSNPWFFLCVQQSILQETNNRL